MTSTDKSAAAGAFNPDVHNETTFEIEAVIACLGDDAAALREENPESEVAANMERAAELLAALPPADPGAVALDVDKLANEIRRVDGSNSLGAGALAEALMPFLASLTTPSKEPAGAVAKWTDDPHDIEQGQMLNPEWLKLHGLTAAEALAAPGAAIDAREQEIISRFLESTGQYVTNDASREAAIAEAISEARASDYAEGYRDGRSRGFVEGRDSGYNVGRMGGISRPAMHPATADLVMRFGDALRDKLAAAEKKYGYSDGWLSPDWMDECRAKLQEHIAKGDPRDVAAYCAFLWHHGESTASRPEAPPASAPAAEVAQPTDEQILALNAGERLFSESPSRYPEAGFGTQYHAGKPGLLQFAREVIALASSPSSAPAESGWQWVPKEPPPEMLRAAEDCGLRGHDSLYEAMLAAAPQAVQAGGEGGA